MSDQHRSLAGRGRASNHRCCKLRAIHSPSTTPSCFVTAASHAEHLLVYAGVDLEDDNCQEPILQALGKQKLHLLMVVAGLQHYDKLQTLDRKLVRQQLEVNAVGPLFLVQSLQNNLAESSKVSLALLNWYVCICTRFCA